MPALIGAVGGECLAYCIDYTERSDSIPQALRRLSESVWDSKYQSGGFLNRGHHLVPS